MLHSSRKLPFSGSRTTQIWFKLPWMRQMCTNFDISSHEFSFGDSAVSFEKSIEVSKIFLSLIYISTETDTVIFKIARDEVSQSTKRGTLRILQLPPQELLNK